MIAVTNAHKRDYHNRIYWKMISTDTLHKLFFHLNVATNIKHRGIKTECFAPKSESRCKSTSMGERRRRKNRVDRVRHFRRDMGKHTRLHASSLHNARHVAAVRRLFRVESCSRLQDHAESPGNLVVPSWRELSFPTVLLRCIAIPWSRASTGTLTFTIIETRSPMTFAIIESSSYFSSDDDGGGQLRDRSLRGFRLKFQQSRG